MSPRVDPGVACALWLAAALISGFTLRRYLGPLDEGILMQAATRMARRPVAMARLRLGLRARASRCS